MGISILAWLPSIDPNMGRGMITRPIWKCPCIKLFITYFRHLEETPILAWDEVEAHIGPTIWASIWKWSCSNPITGYFPGMWKYGQFTSGHIDHTKMPLFELVINSDIDLDNWQLLYVLYIELAICDSIF